MKIILSKKYTIFFRTPFRFSEAGYYHFIFLAFSFCKGGFGIHFFGFNFSFSWSDNKQN